MREMGTKCEGVEDKVVSDTEAQSCKGNGEQRCEGKWGQRCEGKLGQRCGGNRG